MTLMTTAELRGYQQICGPHGFVLAIACDQRGGIRKIVASDAAAQAAVTDAQLGDIKIGVTRDLASHAPCILLDPVCALPKVIREGALPRDVALLIGLDASGYDEDAEGHYKSRLAKGMSARRVRELGATGGKIMVYLRSDHPHANAHNIDILKRCIADFAAEDLLLVVEFLTYKLPSESDADYKAKFPSLIEGGSRICLELGSKILKIPYPGNPEACAAITKLCAGVPWAVLSAGVDHSTFLGQVEISMAAGASGVIAGRSLWKDCVSLDPAVQRERLRSKAVPRLQELQDILNKHARPRA